MNPAPDNHAPRVLDAADLYCEEVLEARLIPGARKIELGIELFELASELAKADIRSQNPKADEIEVLRLLGERLDLGRKLDSAQ